MTRATTTLDEMESKELLKQAGIPIVETRLATTEEEAVKISGALRFPVALKIASRDVAHKSDVGGVRLGIQDDAGVREAFRSILRSVKGQQPAASIAGVTVQKMAGPGIEMIVGVSRDPNFGPVLVFGLGGLLVEVLNDVSLRVLPIERRDATAMLEELRARPVLEGFRGRPGANLRALEDLLVSVSEFVMLHPEIEQLDLNPLIAYPDGNLVVDARVVLA